MYISLEQIDRSLENLVTLNPFFGTSFLAFKRIRLPVGKPIPINFTQITTDILNRHYRPSSTYQGYYTPFDTSDKRNRWVKPRYPSTTLQRITKDTFRDALLHPSPSEWGWRKDYIQRLRTHLSQPIPAFDLGVWLFRSDIFAPDTGPQSVLNRLFDEYRILPEEILDLFDTSFDTQVPDWVQERPVFEHELLNLLGAPPGSLPEGGAALRALELRAVGPTTHFVYEPADRLNVITGDNSLGKTFLLECIWWALTSEWLDQSAMPRTDVAKKTPKLSFSIYTMQGRSQGFSSSYNWDQQRWILPSRRSALAGLVVYARHDGSCAIWDPARLNLADQSGKTLAETNSKISLLFHRDDIWYGLSHQGRKEWICNGLLRDWVTWQTSGERYGDRWNALVASLKALSPSEEPLMPDEPTKLPFDELEIPTIRMPYGKVPLVHASAGVQRAVAIAYLLVWSWFKHLENSSVIRREPQKRIVLIVDEVEAHLHPFWQRTIVPSLMCVISQLAPSALQQIHLATHSPMVMASVEPVFDHEYDKLHHLKLTKNDVALEGVPFEKRGRADLWLVSNVFGLQHARSIPAERAIQDAIALQQSQLVEAEAVCEVHSRLIRYLAQDDDFWPRWRYFAKNHGVEK